MSVFKNILKSLHLLLCVHLTTQTGSINTKSISPIIGRSAFSDPYNNLWWTQLGKVALGCMPRTGLFLNSGFTQLVVCNIEYKNQWHLHVFIKDGTCPFLTATTSNSYSANIVCVVMGYVSSVAKICTAYICSECLIKYRRIMSNTYCPDMCYLIIEMIVDQIQWAMFSRISSWMQ